MSDPEFQYHVFSQDMLACLTSHLGQSKIYYQRQILLDTKSFC
ncbi:hypothetical protein Golax_013007 [Gossypium laxum]|uniref:Uncharacterized protein n=1 Tax=Gossypium laxum TaxID=34288 RepID=A0A7J8ZQG6_9ROSI|nr:hypothetical protein [Gossypium laxum]